MERGGRDRRADQGDHALERHPGSLRRSLARGPWAARGGGGGLLVALIAIALLLADRIERQERGPAEEPAASATSGGEGVPAPGRSAGAEVLRVVDGDTIEVMLGGERARVRYIGIDTPESVQPGQPVECFGPQAAARNRELVEGQRVRLRFDRELRDRYGRLLAYVHVGSTFVNAELVKRGYARRLEIEPNTARAGLLERLELRASRAGHGLWARCP